MVASQAKTRARVVVSLATKTRGVRAAAIRARRRARVVASHVKTRKGAVANTKTGVRVVACQLRTRARVVVKQRHGCWYVR